MYLFDLNKTDGLINYWPFAGSYIDLIRQKDMTSGSNYDLTVDRRNFTESALKLTNGYRKIPADVYFSGNLTISLWTKYIQFKADSRIIDFSNGFHMNNFIIAIDATGILRMRYYINDTFHDTTYSLNALTLNKWEFLVFTLNGTIGAIYINGIKGNDYDMLIPENLVRSNCYIGRMVSYHSADYDVNAEFDDLKFYNRVLSKTEIDEEYNEAKRVISKIN